MKVVLRLLLALIFVAVTVTCAPADNTTGSGASACQFYPTLGVGNGDNSCVSNTKYYYQAITPGSACTTTGMNITVGYMANLSLADDPAINPNIFAAFANNSAIPGVCQINMSTGTVTSGTLGAGCTTTSNGHNGASVAQLGNGYVGMPMCAADDPASCLAASGGGTGTSQKCEYFTVGNCVGTACGANAGVSNIDLLAAGSQHALPVGGLSEATNAKYGSKIVVTGQAQRSQGSGVSYFAGGASYVAMNALTGSNVVSVDQACAQGGSVTTYLPLTQAIGSFGCSAGQQWSKPAHDNSVYTVSLSTDTSGNTLTLNFPAVASFTGATCTFSLTGTAATDVSTIASAIHTGSLTGTNCSNTGTVYSGIVVSNTSTFWTNCGNTSCFDVTLNTGDPNSLGTPSAATCTCTLVYTNIQALGGVHILFQWGGTRLLLDRFGTPHWYEIFDNELPIAAASGHSTQAGGIGLNMAVFCAVGNGPANGVWTWGDATCGKDGFSFQMSPALLNSNNAFYVGSGAGGSCTTAACTEYNGTTTTFTAYPLIRPCTCTKPATIPQFVYTYGQTDLPVSTANIIQAGKDITLDGNGNLGVGYGCYDNSGFPQVCYLTVDTTTGNTTQQVVVDGGSTASNQVLQIALTTTPAGNLVMDVSTGNCGIYSGCSGGTTHGTAITRYVSTNNGATWAKTFVKKYGGTDSAAATCDVFDTIDGMHIFQLCMPGNSTAGSTTYNLYDEYTGNQ